jgi:hypothetical protein
MQERHSLLPVQKHQLCAPERCFRLSRSAACKADSLAENIAPATKAFDPDPTWKSPN